MHTHTHTYKIKCMVMVNILWQLTPLRRGIARLRSRVSPWNTAKASITPRRCRKWVWRWTRGGDSLTDGISRNKEQGWKLSGKIEQYHLRLYSKALAMLILHGAYSLIRVLYNNGYYLRCPPSVSLNIFSFFVTALLRHAQNSLRGPVQIPIINASIKFWIHLIKTK